MKALNNQEMAVELFNEITLVDNAPKKSIFQFHINETVEELLLNMKEKDGEQWDIKENADGTIELWDRCFFSVSTIMIETIMSGKVMRIKTAWSGFEYYIFSCNDGGAEVRFEGPLNALLRQNLLPSMSYVPHSLEAKYEDMQEYVSIDTYCLIREERHGGKKNEQDDYGAWVNKSFNNEIPVLPLWTEKEVEETFDAEVPAQATYSLGDVMLSLANKL